MKLQPLKGYILVEPLEEGERSKGGFVIPETVKDKPAKGTVITVGEAPKDETAQVKVGETVVYKKWGGQDVLDNEKELKLVAFNEIMGVYR